MAKRFTDTELYDRENFLRLPPRLKVAWEILNKRCNFFGVWQISMTKLSFEVGESVTLDELQEHFKVRVIEGDKLYIEGFVAFQYGDDEGRLSPSNRFHRSIAEKLKSHGLPDPLWKPLEEGIDTLSTPYRQGQGKGQGKGKGKGNSKKGSAEGKQYSPEFEAAWKAYPRKDDKSDAFKAYAADVKPEEHSLVLTAIEHYKAKLKQDGTAAKFVKLGATFFRGRWRDCLEPTYGKTEDFSKAGPDSGDAWEATAKRVLDAIVKAGGGSGAYAEREAVLGHELHAIAVRAGIQRIRDVKRDGYQIKAIADMLKHASSHGGAA